MWRYIIEVFGWYGVVAIVGAYALVSFNYIEAGSLTYQLLNASGAVGILVVSWYKRNYQPVALNVIWLLIAAVALWQMG
jgi:multidrug transporter EmrE-like cation transporter